jgi:hypothetical protein
MLTAAQFVKLTIIEDRMYRCSDQKLYNALERERFLILAGKDEPPKNQAAQK